MNLIGNIHRATSTADELDQATQRKVGVVDQVDQFVATIQGRVSASVDESQKSLDALRKILDELDSGMEKELRAAQEAFTQVRDRSGRLRDAVHTQTDESTRAADAFLASMEAALVDLEAELNKLQHQLEELAVEESHLQTQAQARALDAQKRAEQIVAGVQAEQADLQQRSAELVARYEGAGTSVTTRMQQSQQAFEETEKAADEAIDRLLERFGAVAAKTWTSADTHLAQQTAALLTRLAEAVGQHVTELRQVSTEPRRASEEELQDIGKRLHQTLEPLFVIDQVHKKAVSLDLYELGG